MADLQNSPPNSQRLLNKQPKCPFFGLAPLLSSSATYQVFIKSEGRICPLIENFPSECTTEEADWNKCKFSAEEYEEKVKAFCKFSVWDGNNKPKGKCFGPPMSFREWTNRVMGQNENSK